MPTNLTSAAISATFAQLLHVDGGPSATEKPVYGGAGVQTAFSMGTQSVSVGNIKFYPDGRIVATSGDLELSAADGTVVISGFTLTGVNLSGLAVPLAVSDGGTGASTVIAARTNLGLGDMATQNPSAVSISGGTITGITDLAILDGGTGASTAAAARTNLGLGNMAVQAADNVLVSGGIVRADELGHADGGSVTQATSRTTGVTLNTASGEIELFDATLAAATAEEFTLTNDTIDEDDVVVITMKGGTDPATRGFYHITVVEVSTGAAVISVANLSAAALPAVGTEIPVIQFAVIKGAIS